MPRTCTYAYSPGSGAPFHIEVSGKPFGAASDSEEEEADAAEAQGARGAWLSLLRAAVDAAFDEVEMLSPAEMVLKKIVPEMSAGSPITALDWQSPSDVSTEVPWDQDSPSPAARSPVPRHPAEGAAVDPRREAAGGDPNLAQGSSAEDLPHASDGATERRFKVCAAPPYQGVQYRRSKRPGDLHPWRFAENGTDVLGYPEDAGAWLRLAPRREDGDAEDLYLPVMLEGERLLRPRARLAVREERPRTRSNASSPFSWTCCVREMDESDGDPFLVRESVGEVAAEPVE